MIEVINKSIKKFKEFRKTKKIFWRSLIREINTTFIMNQKNKMNLNK